MTGRRERTGVFGGTFDPVHVGHVVAAVEARWSLGLDRMLLVVAADPWQKRGSVGAPAADRFDLVRAAVGGIDGLEACDVEIARGGASVTADTLEALGAPERSLVLVVGADVARRIPTWRRAGDLPGLAALAVVERPGDDARDGPGDGPDGDWLPGRSAERVVIPRLDVSSTDIRARVASGRPIDGLVPAAVAGLIRARGLYTAT